MELPAELVLVAFLHGRATEGVEPGTSRLGERTGQGAPLASGTVALTMRLFGLALLLGVVAAPAAAGPPKITNYARIDNLRAHYDREIARLQRDVAFRAKPRIERMIIRYGEHRMLEGKKLTGDYVVMQVFEEWGAIKTASPAKADVKILMLLPEALKANYAGIRAVGLNRKERLNASKPLVKALMNDHLYVRQAAIDCLKAIYGTNHLYRADASKRERSKAQKDWGRFIKRKR